MIAASGVKFTFVKSFSKAKKTLAIRIDEAIQKHLKVKSGDTVLTSYCDKNNFILYIKKNKNTAKRGSRCNRQQKGNRLMSIKFGWYSNETVPTWALSSNQAHYELLKNGILKIDLLRAKIEKTENEYRELQILKDRFY